MDINKVREGSILIAPVWTLKKIKLYEIIKEQYRLY